MAKKDLRDLFAEFASGNQVTVNRVDGSADLYLFGGSGSSDAEEKAETSIEELRNKYYERTKALYEQNAQKLRAERDNALRENWVLQQQAEAALPEQLAAAGINGGATETTLAALKARYQGNRNDIQSGYMDNLGELSAKHSEEQAENERAFSEKWIEYLLSLAQMEEEYKKKRALEAMNY